MQICTRPDSCVLRHCAGTSTSPQVRWRSLELMTLKARLDVHVGSAAMIVLLITTSTRRDVVWCGLQRGTGAMRCVSRWHAPAHLQLVWLLSATCDT
mmetsp:Transcript_40296/g.89489  ORF Transcript_40296/g.89489 Transcript_40296/m.89489 type:complete len:97 (+) Transcript_40296:100-390(+)